MVEGCSHHGPSWSFFRLLSDTESLSDNGLTSWLKRVDPMYGEALTEQKSLKIPKCKKKILFQKPISIWTCSVADRWLDRNTHRQMMEKLRSLYNTLAVVEVKPSDWLNIRTSLLLFRCPFGSNCLFAPPPSSPPKLLCDNKHVNSGVVKAVVTHCSHDVETLMGSSVNEFIFVFCVCVYVCALWPVRSVVMGVGLGWGRERGVGEKKKRNGRESGQEGGGVQEQSHCLGFSASASAHSLLAKFVNTLTA